MASSKPKRVAMVSQIVYIIKLCVTKIILILIIEKLEIDVKNSPE